MKKQGHLGTSSIAWSRYFPLIENNPKVELVAVCDVVEEYLKKKFLKKVE